MCDRCGAQMNIVDGILDFANGPLGPLTAPTDYDALHQVNNERSAGRYRHIKRLAGTRWPNSLGSVLEVGCGTGLLSRALIGSQEAHDIVLTDASADMLRATRTHLDQAGLLSTNRLTFATHSGTEPCFRDSAFDTCVGSSVLHHIADVRGFLANVFRWLKPGGRAFFMEPNLLFHRALGQTLADILSLMYHQAPEFIEGRQAILNVIGHWRLGILHQGDLPFLARLEDKHMFAASAFEDMGHELGFATVSAIPTGWQPTGKSIVAGLCRQLDIQDPVRSTVLGLLPAYATRYISLLGATDQSDSFLLWLEKGVGPLQRSFHSPPRPDVKSPGDLPENVLTGGMPPRWTLTLHATATPDGLSVAVAGWCLVNTDVLWIRVTLGGVTRNAPVWLPTTEVHAALNTTGLYASWNALCCGVQDTLRFDGDAWDLKIEVVLANGHVLAVSAPATLPLDETIAVNQ